MRSLRQTRKLGHGAASLLSFLSGRRPGGDCREDAGQMPSREAKKKSSGT